ncbi:MAG: alpha/beta fold hydrolase [Myxococcales bacterium]|nr:alpha/beta fold hydrolase [Myxococcales bacterium]
MQSDGDKPGTVGAPPADEAPQSERAPRPRRKRGRFELWARWARRSAENAMELVRIGRLGESESAPYAVVHHSPLYRLRHYSADFTHDAPRSAPLVLVPPLMLTAEIYDVSPELSAVGLLTAADVDCWVVDFGAPEREEGGMQRTLDDHVRAVVDAVEHVKKLTGRDVHLAGYSQGGMFAYQAAAYLRSQGIASVITFGSPVDIHKNVPALGSDVTRRIIRAARPMVEVPLERIEGLPGRLTSTGFKLLTPRKELEQIFDFVRKLHDRQALQKRETRRRFLGGEGFVAWPGPALRKFFDDFIVHNRLVAGGFVIDGRSVTLSDVTCAVLRFVGSRDDFARPAAVRAIVKAAPHAEHHESVLRAGHFGLVVGSTALRESWPTVAAWVKWRDGTAGKPAALSPRQKPPVEEEELELEEAAFDVDFAYELFVDEAKKTAAVAWKRVGRAVRDAGHALDNLRWQLPRLARLERITDDTLVSPGRALAEQAQAIGDRTFFLWKGRAFTYRDADARVSHVTAGLIACGVEPAARVGVLMAPRPSCLSLVTAVNRLGAVPVLCNPTLGDEALRSALAAAEVTVLATDPENAARARLLFAGSVLSLGGGGAERALPEGVRDMEAVDPAAVTLPAWYRPNPGRARDLCMILMSDAGGGEVRLSRVSHHRWAFSALGVASACTLNPEDTVYSCLPLHHATGMMVTVGGALMGGSRLALASSFVPERFWSDVRRYGATVAFYAGDMCRPLVHAPPTSSDRSHSLRLFAGSGMRRDVWQKLRERFGVGVLEFYASTERNLVLANASGKKVGALGRPLPGSSELAIVAYDYERRALREREGGQLVRCLSTEPGVALARLEPSAQGPNVLRDVFEPGDRWFQSGDVLREDSDGEFWFVDRANDMLVTPGGAVASTRVEDALYELADVRWAAAYGVRAATGELAIVASVVALPTLDPERLTAHVGERLRPHERPHVVRVVRELPLGEGFRPQKARLKDAGLAPDGELPVFRYDAASGAYRA